MHEQDDKKQPSALETINDALRQLEMATQRTARLVVQRAPISQLDTRNERLESDL